MMFAHVKSSPRLSLTHLTLQTMIVLQLGYKTQFWALSIQQHNWMLQKFPNNSHSNLHLGLVKFSGDVALPTSGYFRGACTINFIYAWLPFIFIFSLSLQTMTSFLSLSNSLLPSVCENPHMSKSYPFLLCLLLLILQTSVQMLFSQESSLPLSNPPCQCPIPQTVL